MALSKTRAHFLNTSYIFSSKVLISLINLVSQIILARFLLPEGRGEYTVCIIFSIMLGTVFFLSSDVGIRNKLALQKISINQAFSYLVGFTFVFSLIAIISGILLIKTDISFFEKASTNNFLISLAIIPFQQISDQQIILLSTNQNFKESATFLVISELLKVILIAVFIKNLNLGVSGALLAQICANIIIIFIIFYNTKFFYSNIKFQSKLVKDILSHGIRFYIGKISNLSNIQIGTIIMAFFLEPRELGIYAVGSAFILKIRMIPDSINTVLIPRIAYGKSDKEVNDIILRNSKLLFYICGILLLVLAVLANLIISLLFGNEYIQAAYVIQILCIGLLFHCTLKPIEAYFAVISIYPQIASKAVLYGIIVNIISLVYFLPKFGIYGAAISISLNYIISSFYLLFEFKEKRQIQIRDLLKLDKKNITSVIKNYLKEI